MKKICAFACKAFLAFVVLPYSLFSQAWIARHGLTPAQYQTEFNNNSAAGYRLISVNGYTTNGSERYIAYWEKVTGSAQIARHGLSAAQYQTEFNTQTSNGYILKQVSGYAVGTAAKFAAIWEKRAAGAWVARHNLTAAQYQTEFNTHSANGYRIQHVSGYVVNGVEYFAAFWEKVAGVAQIARHNLTSAQYQSAFNTYTSQGYVLKTISGYNKGGTDLYAAIWEKVSIPVWVARHGTSTANYQHEVDNFYYQGYRPRILNAFASGTSAKFNHFWVNNNWTGANLSKIDNAVSNYMTAQNVKGVTLAVTKNGRLVYAKGYGYANPSTGEIMSPNHSLRIMSISKSVTSVGIMLLVQTGKISLTQKVFGPNSILGAKYPTPAGKEQLNNIQVRHLLSHTSGLRTCNGESVFWDQTKTPDNAMNVLLQSSNLINNNAGVVYEYSNTGFFILERIIEQVTGLKYESYIRTNVLNKAGIGSSMYVGLASGNIKAGEGTYTPMHNMNLQLWAGFGGWVARSTDLLKFLTRVDGSTTPSDIISAATHTTMTTGTTQNPSYALGWVVSGALQNHNGCFGGSSSFLVERPNGISYSIILNSTPTNGDCSGGLKNALDVALGQVTAFPAYNLFDNIGTGARAEENAYVEEIDAESTSESQNLVNAYPKPSKDGVIHLTNAQIITGITVIDAQGHTERHNATAELRTGLKGLLILKIDTEQGTVTEKIVVE